MKSISNAIREIVDRMVVFLRYFAAPLVAVSTVWIVDHDHNVFAPVAMSVVARDTWFWLILASLGLLGVSVYSVHRAVFVPWLEDNCNRLKGKQDEPSADDRSFARWQRRVAKADSPARSAQKVLDQGNATGDFLYCSSWCIVALTVLWLVFFPGHLKMTLRGRVGLIAIATAFWCAGFIQHHHMVRLDRKAYNWTWVEECDTN